MEGLREEGREMRPEDGRREEGSKASKKERKGAKREGRKTIFMNLKNNPFLNSNKIIPTLPTYKSTKSDLLSLEVISLFYVFFIFMYFVFQKYIHEGVIYNLELRSVFRNRYLNFPHPTSSLRYNRHIILYSFYA